MAEALSLSIDPSKEFAGVISDWHWDIAANNVVGSCKYHKNEETKVRITAALHDEPVIGYMMHTSEVVEIHRLATFDILETKNSYYILVNCKRRF